MAEHGPLSEDLLERIGALVDNPTQRVYNPKTEVFEAVGRRLFEAGLAYRLVSSPAFHHMGQTIQRAAARDHEQRRRMQVTINQFVGRMHDDPAWFRKLTRFGICPPVPVKPAARRRYQRRRR